MEDGYTPTTEEVEDYATEVNGAYALTREEFDRWLNAQLADAWDGGYADGRFNGDPFIKNPYRKAER